MDVEVVRGLGGGSRKEELPINRQYLLRHTVVLGATQSRVERQVGPNKERSVNKLQETN